jgi:hypothetical protein
MEQLKALSRARQIVLGAGVLLLVVTFFPWQSWSAESFGVSAGWSVNAWHGFWGVLLGLLTIAIVAWTLARAFGIELPANIPDGITTLALGGAILVCAVLKNLTDDYSAWGSYVGVVLAALVAVGAWMNFQESGEELPSLKTSGSTSAAAGAGAAGTAPAAPPSTPPAAEPPAAPAEPTPPATGDGESPPSGGSPA